MSLHLVKTIKCRVAEISLRSDGVLYMEFGDDLTIELEDRLEIVKIIHELANGEKRPVLMKTGDRIKITEEARKFDMSGAVEKSVTKEALIIQSLTTRISAHFYYKIRKPGFEVKVFKNQEDAEDWLKESVITKSQSDVV